MARVVCYYKGKFFEFTTVAEGPATDLMDEATFIEFSTRMYGELYAEADHRDGLKARMERARECGVSSMMGYESLEDFLKGNTIMALGKHDEELEARTGDGYVSGWPGLDEYMRDNFTLDDDNLVDEQPDIVMPGDTGQQGEHHG